MEENLHILKEIGAQRIHKDTHISKEYVQAMIHGSFDGLSSVQLNGFISILEREYGVNLSELKRQGKAYFTEEEGESAEPKKVFVTPQREKNNSPMYIWAGIIVFVAVAYYSFGYLSSMANLEQDIDNSHIEDAQKIASTSDMKEAIEVVRDDEDQEVEVIQEIEKTKLVPEVDVIEEVKTEEVPVEKAEVKKEVVKEVQTLKILPKRKIWAGYINIKTNQKYQKVFRKEFVLDTNKDWLLLFGSGTVHLEVNGKKQTFSSKQNMRFKYVDGKFKKIAVTEFKSLNKGRKW
ncbi:MAG: hypothetical protein ACI9TV_001990 [Sulfurimonas sp.]|jgi:hypothetical protein|uniref:hypothetical protein n=1 Tax=Sulfurimonas sp. TaxID=2022749 RepID=UPI0039E2B9C5